MNPQEIYVRKIGEAIQRLNASESFLSSYLRDKSEPMLESAVLQTRKAMESVAYAAISPNRASYEKLRAQADKPADFRKDFNARALLQFLAKVNPDFYPTPLIAPVLTGPRQWHFGRRADGYLTKRRFETFYDRLGKYLHADNPWGNDKGIVNLISDLPVITAELRALISLHKTVVRAPGFLGVWVTEVPSDGSAPRIIIGEADGDFTVGRRGG